MYFRDLIAEDNKNVFFNPDEMGEELNIDGEIRKGTFTSTGSGGSSRNKDGIGLNEGLRLALICETDEDEDFYYRKKRGSVITINKVNYWVEKRFKESGAMFFDINENQAM